jgi:hypothetical protein
MKTCMNCGKEYEPKIKDTERSKFCDRKCQCQYRKKHYRIMQAFICKYCGKEFNPKGYDRVTYCSRECAYKDHEAKPKEPKPIIISQCVICGKEFQGKGKYCSDECRRTKGRNDYYAKYKVTVRDTNEYIEKKCALCGIVFRTNYRASMRRFCSDKCMDRYFKEEYKATRKKQMKVAFVKQVYFEKIYKRDKGICQICGQLVKHDKEPSDIMAATIDHITPLSRGGKHLPENCQLAHRICNSLKGDRLMSEVV